MLHWVENAIRYRKLFVRKRKSERIRALGIVLYHLGLSLRDVSMVLGYAEDASHEAVREWYSRCKHIFDVDTRERRALAIDESKIKVQGKWLYVWAAIDIDTWEVVHAWVSQGRSGFEALQFIRAVLKKCKNKPFIYVDGGPWYPWALNRLGVPWERKTFGPRNPIEQWFGILKQRIKRFYNRWPHNATIDKVNEWIRSFVNCYNLRRLGGALCS